MVQTLKRGGKAARRVAAQRGAARKVEKARRRTGGAIDGVMRRVPLSDQALHRVALVLILALVLAAAWAVARAAGLPELARRQLASVAADAGFRVAHVEVRGVNRMNELKIYEHVLSRRDEAMTEVDVHALRDELLALSWVRDARVSRQLPDTLVIDVVERSPHALLRQGERLVLIDETGHVLEPLTGPRPRGLLVLAGSGVGARVAALHRLLDTAPALRPQVAEAEWVGNRRWNLTFHTRQVLALPEGDAAAAAALLSFARIDGVNRLLGGRVAAFDMRASDRIYLRVPGHADETAKAAGASAGKHGG